MENRNLRSVEMQNDHLDSQLLAIIDKYNKAGRKQLELSLDKQGIRLEKSTIIRHLNKLIDDSILRKEGNGKNTVYMRDDLSIYLSLPPHERQQVGYNVELLEHYRPNKSF